MTYHKTTWVVYHIIDYFQELFTIYYIEILTTILFHQDTLILTLIRQAMLLCQFSALVSVMLMLKYQPSCYCRIWIYQATSPHDTDHGSLDSSALSPYPTRRLLHALVLMLLVRVDGWALCMRYDIVLHYLTSLKNTVLLHWGSDTHVYGDYTKNSQGAGSKQLPSFILIHIKPYLLIYVGVPLNISLYTCRYWFYREYRGYCTSCPVPLWHCEHGTSSRQLLVLMKEAQCWSCADGVILVTLNTEWRHGLDASFLVSIHLLFIFILDYPNNR